MGFYLGKSSRAGPIRFNLSKSSIGASFGVTGARDRRLLLTRDGVATPTCLTTPDALRAGAIVAALAESR